MRTFLSSCATTAALFALVACSSDPSGPVVTPLTASLTVDASQGFAYVKLGATAQPVTVNNAATSTAWDIGLFATTVTTNGGVAGPGGVTAHCLCANAAATTTQLQAFTPANQLAAFEAVTASQIPADAQFSPDSLLPAISGWFSGVGAQASASATRSWIVRRGSGTVILAKLRVTSIQSASAQNAGIIGFEFAGQPSPGAAFGPVVQATADVRAGPVYYDLTTRATTTAAGTWDLRFSGFEIRTNGGVSGAGTVMAVVDNSTPFASIDAAYAATAPVVAYKRDASGGTFVAKPWYRYNITGTDNQIWPTFNVYLVKRGGEVYKVQLTSYYGISGASRQITIRYARLR
ncbi:MAG: HmuY family protein [Gemmatimonadaceae bacterium]